ncbi:hypothetical protein EI555_017149 [Monodon monoceros]|uniref:Uncharacterized protein n=1 Tax=Monodon monoceros TaxID=40151 RepID=A0A4U1EYY7_MONMO|nr:hypothetical protein EI555_017149 [Monodon monoceros]
MKSLQKKKPENNQRDDASRNKLALAELYEPQELRVMTNLSHLQVEDTDWVIPFVSDLNASKIAKEIPLVLLQLVQNGQRKQKLGSLTPEIVNIPSSPEEKSVLNAVVPVDDSVPITKIPIRLANERSRMFRTLLYSPILNLQLLTLFLDFISIELTDEGLKQIFLRISKQ